MGLDGVERFSYFQSRWQDQNNKQPKKKKIIIIFLFIFIILIVLFYFFIFKNGLLQSNRSVEVNISGLEETSAGEENDFTVGILNNENSELIDAELILNFPEKFKLISSEPVCDEKSDSVCVIDLGKVASRGFEEIKFKGMFFAEVGEKVNLAARLSFRMENFSSWFKKEIFQDVIIGSSAIDLITEGPNELMNGEEGIFHLKVKNNEKGAVTVGTMVAGEGFSFIDFQPVEAETIENGKQWKFTLVPDEEKQIDFSGYFLGENENQKLAVQLGFFDEQNNFLSQVEKDFNVKLSKPGLVLGLRANDSFLDEINQNFGDQVKFALSYKNISQDKILEPSFKINIMPDTEVIVDKKDAWQWQQSTNQISLDNFKSEKTDNLLSLTFSSAEINEINPGEEGEINFNLKIKKYEDLIKEKPQNLKIDLTAEATAKVFKNQILVFNIKSNQITINVNPLVKFDAEARYFSDEGMKIGSGPLPPVVGEATSYFIYLQPINYNNFLNEVKITADLPASVEWFGEKKTSQGELTFDEVNKKITWQIDSLPPYSGGSYSYVEASFKIGLKPSQENKGQLMNLLENINLSANNGLVDFKIDNLTTDLINDNLGKDKGEVQ
jgi:hypothetical protein